MTQIVKRTAEATGLSERTVKRIRAEEAGGPFREQQGPSSARQYENAGKPQITIDDFMMSAIRLQVHSFYLERRMPTVDEVFQRCQSNIENFPDMKRTAFYHFLKELGFRYRKCGNPSAKPMERPEVVAWRHRFLRTMRKCRSDGRKFCGWMKLG